MNGKSLVLTLLSCLCVQIHLWSQTGFLAGTIADLNNHEPLISATIQSGSLGTVTDFDGSFRLELPVGRQNIMVSYIGYTTITKEVTIQEGQTTSLVLELSPEATLLQTATVTSGKYEKPLGEVSVSLEVLKPGLIESTGKISIDEALQKVPGLTIIDRQANIRGGSGYSYGAGSRVLLLVDDMPILQADAAFPNWDDVPIENIEQVEVLKGAASALYGSSALNGIVNIRTAYPKAEPQTKVALFGVAHGKPDTSNYWWDKTPTTKGLSISHRQKWDKLSLTLGGYYLDEETSNEFTAKNYGRVNVNTQYRLTQNLNIGLNTNVNLGKTSAYFYWRDGQNPYTGNNLSVNERLRFNIDPYATYYAANGIRHRLQGRFYYVNNESKNNNQSNQSNNYYSEYQAQKHWDNGATVTGGLVASGANVRAELYGDTTFTAFNLAAYLQWEQTFFDKLHLSGGFRYEQNRLNNPGFAFGSSNECLVNPSDEREAKPVFRVGASYQAGKYTYLRSSFGQGYRFPTVAEKFIFTDVGGFSVAPSPFLQSETGWSAEIGLKQGFRFLGFDGFGDLAFFQTNYQDMMEFNLVFSFIPDPCLGAASFRAVNIGGADIKGLEFTLAGQRKSGNFTLGVLGGYTYIDPRYEDFDRRPIGFGEEPTRGQINANNSSAQGNILKYRPQHTAKIDVEAGYKSFTTGWESIYRSRIDAIDAVFLAIIQDLQRYQDADQGIATHAFRLAYRISPAIKVNAIVANAFNREYMLRPGLMGPTRNLTLRLEGTF